MSECTPSPVKPRMGRVPAVVTGFVQSTIMLAAVGAGMAFEKYELGWFWCIVIAGLTGLYANFGFAVLAEIARRE